MMILVGIWVVCGCVAGVLGLLIALGPGFSDLGPGRVRENPIRVQGVREDRLSTIILYIRGNIKDPPLPPRGVGIPYF